MRSCRRRTRSTSSPINRCWSAGGRITVGLVGQPANQTVTLNINGKEHALAAGDAIAVVNDDKTTCHVTVQSFDMFKATFNTACGAKKS